MPHAHPCQVTSFEAVAIGLGIPVESLYLIVPESTPKYLANYLYWPHARYVGTKENCERRLPDYPQCKIVI